MMIDDGCGTWGGGGEDGDDPGNGTLREIKQVAFYLLD